MIERGEVLLPKGLVDALTVQFFGGALDVARFNVFAARRFQFRSGVSLDVSIIGKSHAIVLTRGERQLTELVACVPDEQLGAEAVARRVKFVAIAGKDSVRVADSIGRLRVSYTRMPLSPTLISRWVGRAIGAGAVSHRFPSPCGIAMTVVDVDETTSSYETIHTYPESDSAVVTKTELF
ncbi:MAG: DUF2617 family protein [Deltaproteobacteria bacterium]|nr:DUF2617 family protein [Deltaproteobacteria bacterium]